VITPFCHVSGETSMMYVGSPADSVGERGVSYKCTLKGGPHHPFGARHAADLHIQVELGMLRDG